MTYADYCAIARERGFEVVSRASYTWEQCPRCHRLVVVCVDDPRGCDAIAIVITAEKKREETWRDRPPLL